MNKIKPALIAIILIAIECLWYWYLPRLIPENYGTFDWFPYLLIVPIVFYICLSFEKLMERKTIGYVALGVLISILAHRDLAHSCWYFKIIATLIGAAATIVLSLRKKEKMP